jgi:hypothetical protein
VTPLSHTAPHPDKVVPPAGTSSGPALDWLGFVDLLAVGLDARTASRVLGPHDAVRPDDLNDVLALLGWRVPAEASVR